MIGSSSPPSDCRDGKPRDLAVIGSHDCCFFAPDFVILVRDGHSFALFCFVLRWLGGGGSPGGRCDSVSSCVLIIDAAIALGLRLICPIWGASGDSCQGTLYEQR